MKTRAKQPDHTALTGSFLTKKMRNYAAIASLSLCMVAAIVASRLSHWDSHAANGITLRSASRPSNSLRFRTYILMNNARFVLDALWYFIKPDPIVTNIHVMNWTQFGTNTRGQNLALAQTTPTEITIALSVPESQILDSFNAAKISKFLSTWGGTQPCEMAQCTNCTNQVI